MCFGKRLNGSWHDLSVLEGKKYFTCTVFERKAKKINSKFIV